ncbi:MAG: hypothetical protein HYS51_01315 [Candidatus Zambryskibacteria bacterium]|nr:hypothetical protein [Candidatus Zambryskibacteria bacterium]
MQKRLLLLSAFVLFSIVWLLNRIALTFYLYWTTSWYDIPVHFLAGMAFGVFIVWILNLQTRTKRSFLTVFLLATTTGITWEVFEYIIGDTFAIEGHLLDTISDLLMDAVGATSAYLVATSRSQESF